MARRIILAWLLILISLNALAQAAGTLALADPRVFVGAKKTLTITPADAAQGMTFDFDQAVVAFDPGTLTVTGLKAGQVTLVGHKGGQDTNALAITVDPVTVTVTALKTPLIQGEKRPFQVQITDAGGAAVDLQPTIKSADDTVAKVTGNNTVETVTMSRGDATTTIGVVANGVKLGAIPVIVREAIKSIKAPQTFEIEEGKRAEVNVTLVGERGSEFTPEQRDLEAAAAKPGLLTATENVIQASNLQVASPDFTEVTFSTLEGPGNNQRVEAKTRVNVHVSVGDISFTPDGAVVPRNGSVRLNAVLRTRGGDEVPIKSITWALKDRKNEKFLKLSPSDSSVLVIWSNEGSEPDRPTVAEITATALSTVGGTQFTDMATVRMTGPLTDSDPPIGVQLNIMDDVTARDLYGKVAAEDYYVARVRIANFLNKSPKEELRSASILAFSESIEVAVRYQKQAIDEKGKPNGKWEDVVFQDVGRPDFGAAALLYSLKPPKRNTEATCLGFLTYRPYMFEMMINTVDRRDERSPRTRTFRTLAAIGTLASAVTAVGVPGPSSDLPLAIEKYSSLLIPGIEKLWPNLRENQRQNIVSQTMKSLEEIPSGSDISRVLFFPKHPFRGLVQDHQTRISQICPFRFNIEVAVITQKTSVAAVAAATP